MGGPAGRWVVIALACAFGLACLVGLTTVALILPLVIGYGGGVAAVAVPVALLGVLGGGWWGLARLRRRSDRLC